MNTPYKLAVVLFFFWLPQISLTSQAQELAGQWRMSILCPGGGIEFGLEINRTDGQWSACLLNGPERIEVPSVELKEEKIELVIDHYDSRLVLDYDKRGETLKGNWRKRRGKQEWVEMQVSGSRVAEKPVTKASKNAQQESFTGRWAVQFSSSNDPAVGIIKKNGDRLLGTFLTTTGDYRFLDGTSKNGELQLSCFDGAHAFLFKAKLTDDGSLKGDFWSSSTWHETWTATRNDQASLPDDFKQTKIRSAVKLDSMQFKDLNGKLTTLDDARFSGQARIIYEFGSWCPNCHDAAAYFSELEKKYSGKGLSIVGLAFELTGDFERDAGQVRKYLKRHGSTYPVLVAGIADKAAASKKIPLLDRVRSYPTTIFLDSENNVKAVHTGFTGPATGEAYQKLRSRFESIIDEMLAN
jgi:thiol-disulfide isomerase/thioredoxin